MSKNKINITNRVMKKIKSGQIAMKPKWYFLLGSFSLFVFLFGLSILSVFLISLITFSLKTHGPMGSVRYQQIITNFPWWAVIIAITGLGGAIVLLKKFDFSYKKNFALIILIFIAAVIIAGISIDLLNLDSLWMKRGPMRRFYQRHFFIPSPISRPRQ